MLTLITGQPGNGKTLHLLWLVEKLRKETSRPVYYCDIEELQLSWLRLEDATKWQELPDGAIVVIDEAWKYFPKLKQGASIPEYIQALSEHRHRGFDFFICTQSATDIDTFVRKRCGRHLNVVRKFGYDYAKLYQWEQVQDERSTAAQKVAIVSRWKYPKEYFGLYKSASEHTVRKDFPWRKVSILVIGPLAIIWCGWVVYQNVGQAQIEGVPALKPGLGGAQVDPPSRAPSLNPWDASIRAPRVAGVEQSAPIFDRLQVAKSKPTVAGCMSIASVDIEGDEVKVSERCECFSDQGNTLAVSIYQCRLLMKRGWFDGTKAVRDAKAENIAYLNSRNGLASGGDGAGRPAQQAVGSGPSVDP